MVLSLESSADRGIVWLSPSDVRLTTSESVGETLRRSYSRVSTIFRLLPRGDDRFPLVEEYSSVGSLNFLNSNCALAFCETGRSGQRSMLLQAYATSLRVWMSQKPSHARSSSRDVGPQRFKFGILALKNPCAWQLTFADNKLCLPNIPSEAWYFLLPFSQLFSVKPSA